MSVLASNWLLLSSRGEETGIITSLKYSFLVTCTRQSISYLKKIYILLFSVYIVKQISLETFYFPFQQWASFTYGIIRDVLEFQSLKWLQSTWKYKFYFLTNSLVSLFYTCSCVFFSFCKGLSKSLLVFDFSVLFCLLFFLIGWFYLLFLSNNCTQLKTIYIFAKNCVWMSTL